MNRKSPLSHFIVRAGVLLMLIIGLTCCNNSSESPGRVETHVQNNITGPSPRLTLRETELNFGKQNAGVVLERTVSVMNTGTADLIIKKAMGVGSQISVSHTKDPIKPGDSGQLYIQFNTRGRSGEQRRRIVVISNDPVEPRQYLSLNTDLDLLLGIQPRRVWFGNVSGKNPATGKFEITGSQVRALNADVLQCRATKHSESLSFEILDDRQGASGNIEVTVTIDPQSMDPGQFNIPVEIQTGASSTEMLRVMMTGNIMGPLKISPSRIYFGRYEPGVSMNQTITVTIDSKTPFTITSVYSNSKLFSVESFPQAQVDTGDIVVSFLADQNADPRNRGVLTIETDIDEHGKIDVPMYAFRKVDKK